MSERSIKSIVARQIDFLEEPHWNNSQNVLCNYMKKLEYLEMILENKAIIPRYVIESIEYLELKNDGVTSICFPMTCFCDIPFTKVGKHVERYGEYGIGLNKASMMKNNQVQPVHYINEKSPLARDFREAYDIASSMQYSETQGILSDYILSTLLYMKPICGDDSDPLGKEHLYAFQDECEWRFIPSDHFPDNIPFFLSQYQGARRESFSNVLKNHPECWFKFEWLDVTYIILPRESERENVIKKIKSLKIKETEKDVLISKIEITRGFSDYA